MFKPKGLLKVISVIMIIFGVLGALGVLLIYFMSPQMTEMGMDSLVEGMWTPLSIVTTVVSTISLIMAGVFGVSGKSMRMAVFFGGIYTLFELYGIISAIITSIFNYAHIFTILIIALYWWGIYQSKES